MANFRLTSDADLLLCVLYKSFLENRKNGMPRMEAALFGSSEEIQRTTCPSWPVDDIDDAASELEENGLLLPNFGDDTMQECVLTHKGIAYMEHRFADKADTLFQRITALLSLFL